jgi:hypothetical protein
MKEPFKNLIKNFAPIFLALTTMFLFGFGCKPSEPAPPVPNPLAGFHFSSLNNLDSNKAITDDYKDYIQKLSPKERERASPIFYFEDGMGQHAVQIRIGINGTSWEHVLIYDKDNKRIKTLKYVSGHYAS